MNARWSLERVEALASAKYYRFRFTGIQSYRPLWKNQQCKEARQDSRVDRGEVASFTEQAMYNWVSSAYCCSDRTDPWGTPVRQSVTVEEALPTQTLWVLPNKYKVSHANGEPVMPYLVCNLFKRILWSMVSNAALKSKDTNIVHLPLSVARYMSFNVLHRAVSQECIFLLYRKKLHTVYPMLYKPTLKNSKN